MRFTDRAVELVVLAIVGHLVSGPELFREFYCLLHRTETVGSIRPVVSVRQRFVGLPSRSHPEFDPPVADRVERRHTLCQERSVA